jgi:hypothetical protein
LSVGKVTKTVAEALGNEEPFMAEHSESVKALAKQYRAWAISAQGKGDAPSAARHTRTATALEETLAELERLERITQPIPASYGDLSDLPPSVLKELSGIKADDREQQLYTIIRSADGDEVELDTILIELWRRFKIEETRKFLQNKLWRMAQKKLIYTVPGKKGVYTAMEPPRTARPQPATFDTDLDDDVPF